MKYDSPPTTIDQQISILESRGLEITNGEAASVFLNKVSYYRFCGYALHFEHFKDRKKTHRYKEGTTFDQVMELYSFDSRLRTLIFDAIESIEIAFRTQLCLHFSQLTKDSHWPLDAEHFLPGFNHARFVEEIEKETERSREIFIDNYKTKYKDPPLPASWMLIEIVSFGTWSRVFKSLKDQEAKKVISRFFALSPFILESWIHSLTVLRNLCAHHARIWNKSLTISPALTKSMKRIYRNPTEKKRIGLQLDIICELLKPLGEYEIFIDNLNSLFEDHPGVPYSSMGLKDNHIDKERGIRARPDREILASPVGSDDRDKDI